MVRPCRAYSVSIRCLTLVPLLCSGSPINDLPVAVLSQPSSDLSLNQQQTDVSNVSWPPAAHWPTGLVVPNYSNFILHIETVKPLTDKAQARDMKNAFHALQRPCFNPSDESLQRHTMTTARVHCNVHIPIAEQQLQMAVMASAMEALERAQDTYGPAAVWGKASQSGSDISYGDFESQLWWDVPAKAPRQWPKKIVKLEVPLSDGLHFRLESRGETLDNWSTFWLSWCCAEQILALLQIPDRSKPAASFFAVLNPQLVGVRFIVGALQPTIAQLISALRVLASWFDVHGARELEFNLLNVHGEVVGIGFTSPHLRPDISATGASNSTGIILIDGDGSNKTRVDRTWKSSMLAG
ncbi:MAG: hypothetical protein L6R40_007065 [Gallowayella cf. fulva]|nr:MAG: hypothetical protein L6R40_007065 [Xanthomendoza cf. fulva]